MTTREISRLTLIAIGSNESSAWGDVRETVQKASAMVAALSDKPAKCSGFYRTAAFPAGNGPDFVNAAVAIDTSALPQALLADLHRIEAQAGRVRQARWGQRTLDLDLLAMGDMVLPDQAGHQRWRDLSVDDQQRITPEELVLPHPRLRDRAFVLIPLRDVAPDWRHPILGQTVDQMCEGLSAEAVSEVAQLRP